jgi:hypothetical protein
MADNPPEEDRKLGLMRFVLGSPQVLEIEQPVADALVRGMQVIWEMVSVEQKFAILMGNFLELEQELASRVLIQAYTSGRQTQEFFDDKQSFNRRLINVLTATKLYTDQSHHHVKILFPGEPDRWQELKACFSRQYDDRLSFRTMEALRNYAQHRGLPIQGLTMGSRKVDYDTPNIRWEYNVATNIIISELESDTQFKRAVLDELRSLGGEKGVIDIKMMVREYVECLATVHGEFRTMTDELVNRALALVAEWKGKYIAAVPEHGPDAVALGVGWQIENRYRERIVYLNNEQVDQLEALRARTLHMANLGQRFVTTEAMERP